MLGRPSHLLDELKVVETRDAETIKRVLLHPDIYPYLANVAAPKGDEWTQNEKANYYALHKQNDVIGILVFLHSRHNFCYVDVGILPSRRGKNAYELCRIALENFRKLYPRKVLGAKIRLENKPSQRMAVAMGFKRALMTDKHIYYVKGID